MIRAVLDVNVLVAALLSRGGVPAKLLLAWIEGAYDLLVSPKLLAEVERALAYPKIRARITSGEAAAFVASLRNQARVVPDPRAVERISADPGDDYIIALARAGRATLIVSGDHHLTDLVDLQPPVMTPRDAYRLLLPLAGEEP